MKKMTQSQGYKKMGLLHSQLADARARKAEEEIRELEAALERLAE